MIGPLVDTHAHIYLKDHPVVATATHKPERSFTDADFLRTLDEHGVLFGVNLDGHIRAFLAATGKLIWDYDTAGRRYETVNGVKNQRGGNLDATGITFAGGMGFVMAGFNGASGSSGPDNVLLAFSVDGK